MWKGGEDVSRGGEGMEWIWWRQVSGGGGEWGAGLGRSMWQQAFGMGSLQRTGSTRGDASEDDKDGFRNAGADALFTTTEPSRHRSVQKKADPPTFPFPPPTPAPPPSPRAAALLTTSASACPYPTTRTCPKTAKKAAWATVACARRQKSDWPRAAGSCPCAGFRARGGCSWAPRRPSRRAGRCA